MTFVPPGTPSVRMNPADAAALGISNGDLVRVVSPTNSIELAAKVTDEMMAGVVAIPPGWGQPPGLRVAHPAGGANVNLLASTDVAHIEPLGGMTLLDGIPVRVEAVSAAAVLP